LKVIAGTGFFDALASHKIRGLGCGIKEVYLGEANRLNCKERSMIQCQGEFDPNA
jgi:hypothetical protein